ncbi:hypothetical protein HZB01_05560 [Candidatus Woesearchaeota archaeon]|nr:hypothetical protein [Candidatus Woesearchaeota archaeon]
MTMTNSRPKEQWIFVLLSVIIGFILGFVVAGNTGTAGQAFMAACASINTRSSFPHMQRRLGLQGELL